MATEKRMPADRKPLKSKLPVPSIESFYGQSAHIEHLREAFSSGKQVHAYLFVGSRGTGKRTTALLLAMTALCRGNGLKPCRVCGPCRRVLAGTHPDVHTILPLTDRKTIGPKTIRDVIDEISKHAFEDGTKVILIPQAELMTPAAQNALLKTLEEPPDRTTFLLCTNQTTALLPTIISRCRMVRFHPLETEDAAKRLIALGETGKRALEKARMAEGVVGQALEIDDEMLRLRQQLMDSVFSVKSFADVPAISVKYKGNKDNKDNKENTELQKQAMDVFESIVHDILLFQAGDTSLAEISLSEQACAYAKAVPLSGGLMLMQSISRARRMLGSNVTFRSAWESILLTVSEEYHTWPW